jgi:hypothetical protein
MRRNRSLRARHGGFHPQSIPNPHELADRHTSEKIFCAIPVNRLTAIFPQQNRALTDLQHMVGKISFTTFRLRAISNGAHT